MISHVEGLCAGRDDVVSLHIERFAPSGKAVEVPVSGNCTFEVELRRRGVVLTVPADRSALDVVREVDRPVSADGFYEAVEYAWRARTGEHPRDQLRALDSIESRCRQEERLLFEAFNQGTNGNHWKKSKCEVASCAAVRTSIHAWTDTSRWMRD